MKKTILLALCAMVLCNAYSNNSSATKNAITISSLDASAIQEFNKIKDLKQGESLSVSFENIEFAFNSAELTAQAMILLDQIAVQLNNATWTMLTITGHSDNIGTTDANNKLSRDRAETVKSYLVKKGISANKISTLGVGFTKPLLPNDTPENRNKNRRVEFTVANLAENVAPQAIKEEKPAVVQNKVETIVTEEVVDETKSEDKPEIVSVPEKPMVSEQVEQP
ncbi:MAG: OmpA family protein, partial [Paludibacter sp.]|nr:OmpA family protein [Paludibacter sp.]